MLRPFLEAEQSSADMQSNFGGYNHNISIADNEFFDMKNFTSDKYPLAAVRDKRGTLSLPVPHAKILGITGKDKPFVVFETPSLISAFSANLVKLTPTTGDPPSGSFYTTKVTKSTPSSMFEDDVYIEIGTSIANRYGSSYNYWDRNTTAGTAAIKLYKDKSITSIDSSYSDINGALADKPIYLYCTSGDNCYMRTTALHLESLSDTDETEIGDQVYREAIFSLSEVTEQELDTSLNRTDVYNFTNPGANPVLLAKASDILNDPDADKAHYAAFFNLGTGQLENMTEIGLQSGDKDLLSMGANVIVFPDKKIINTVKITNSQFSEIKNMEYSVSSISATVYLTDLNGHNLTVVHVGPEAPVIEQEEDEVSSSSSGSSSGYYVAVQDAVIRSGTQSRSSSNLTESSLGPYDCWVDTSQTPAVTRRYSSTTKQWASVETYLEFHFSNQGFEDGDAIQITFPSALSGKVDPIENQKYYVIYKATSSYVRVPCAVKAAFSTSGESVTGLTMTRTLPAMDYVIEVNNRLWACRYGQNADGETVNEIMASKLGDPTNWHYFQNTSIDSYYVSLGTDGPFTGSICYQSTPVFFRSNAIHRINGYYPANYQLSTTICNGLRPGCEHSVEVLNDIVYYLSPVGMCAYGGGLPVSLAEPFGEETYKNCISGSIGNKLYCCMTKSDNTKELFVFDDSKQLWHKEDNLNCRFIKRYIDECIAVVGDNSIISLGGIYGTKEDDFEWFIQSGDIGYTSPFRKRLLKLVLRLVLPIKSHAKIEIEYDGDGIWHFVNELRPNRAISSYAVPVSPQRCDHFAIRIVGKGEFRMQSITKFWSEGSEED